MKPDIAVITGGYSGESVISHQSADVVLKYLSKDKYNVWKVLITKAHWVVMVKEQEIPVNRNDFSFRIDGKKITFSGAFIALHGTPGEDGKLQGYLDMLDIPYASCGLMISSITFNKEICNSLLKQYGVVSAGSLLLTNREEMNKAEIMNKVNIPCFVKPNEGGSSLGISKVISGDQLLPAIEKAFKEANQVLIEDFVEGTEITCGVTDYQGEIKALAVTEIVSKNDFFDFDAKYLDNQTEEITPARIPERAYNECLRISEFIYKKLHCRGMVRIDYILSKGNLSLIEVNTIPGLTEKSLLPQQVVYAGITLGELFDDILERSLKD